MWTPTGSNAWVPPFSMFGQCGFSDQIFYFKQWLKFIPKRLTFDLLFSIFLNSTVSLDPDDTVQLPAGTWHSREGRGCFSATPPCPEATTSPALSDVPELPVRLGDLGFIRAFPVS